MKRNAMANLIQWKECGTKRPILLLGIKGVGKTYLALDFAKSFYDGNLYINFENNGALRHFINSAFSDLNNDKDLLTLICEYYELPDAYLGTVLLILDEITECPAAVSMLLQLAPSLTNIPLILISSSTTLLNQPFFYPVTLYPVQFDEYLIAEGNEWYAEVIKGHYQTSRKVPDIVHRELLNSFEDYLKVGGMPAAVNDYLTMETDTTVAELHHDMYQNIIHHMMLHENDSTALKVRQVLSIMPDQLMKDNKKFQYRLIRKGATYAQFKEPIKKLVDHLVLYQSTKLVNGEDEEDFLQFKLFLPDVGILNSLLQKREDIFQLSEDCYEKIIMENYMMQSLTARGYKVHFWESGSLAKIDFLIPTKDGLIPIDTKIKENSRNKSLSVYRNEHEVPYAIRVSNKNFEFTNQVKNIPFYAIFCL